MAVENWNKHKDLEYYSNRVCKCGCGGRIKVKRWHKYDGIPVYIRGHGRKNRHNSKEHNRKISVGERKPRETKICKKSDCNITFEVIIDGWDRNKKYCCKEHYYEDKKGKGQSEEKMRMMRRVLDKLWLNPDFAKRMIEVWHRKPNKLERELNEFLREIVSKEYQINVRAEVRTFGRRCPDFININGQKKIIELFGDYWHGEKRTGISNKQHEQERIDYFAQYDYQTLVIWEHELKDVRKLTEKVLNFNKV